MTTSKAIVKVVLPPQTLFGAEPGDLCAPEVRLRQPLSEVGTRHPLGSLFNVATDEIVAAAADPFETYDIPPFLMLRGESYYNHWSQGEGDDKSYVRKPLAWVEAHCPDELEWGSGKDGKGFLAERTIEITALLDGFAHPVCFRFSRTAIKCATTIFSRERGRIVQKQNAGWIHLRVVKKSRKEGGYWFGWGDVKADDAPPEELERALPMFEAVQAAALAAADAALKRDEPVPDKFAVVSSPPVAEQTSNDDTPF